MLVRLWRKCGGLEICFIDIGEMAEWLNAAVSKTVVPGFRDRGFESLSLRNQTESHMKTIIFIFLFATFIYAQSENWMPVFSDEEKTVHLNANGLDAYQEGDIFVWTQEAYKKAIQMEEIDENIYKVKSYYMISREYKRYSLMEVIYYDEDNNVLKSYRYERNYDNPEFKYSSPILENSDMGKIFEKCLEVIGKGKINN